MTRTRIEIPTAVGALSTPHFDDEATIVTARPVVPIARARAAERSRLVLWILPTALAASVFGALGALGVNYYENRRSPVTQLETRVEPQTNQPASEPLNVAVPTPEPNRPGGEIVTELQPSEPDSSQTEPAMAKEEPPSDKAAATVLTATPAAKTSAPAPRGNGDNGSSNDPGRLTRKRRVHPVTERGPTPVPERPARQSNRGAGRIIDLFEGPNPR